MGRILTGGMFKSGGAYRPKVRDDAADLRKAWKSPSGVTAAARLAGAAGQLIGGLPNPFRSSPDLSEKGLRSSSELLERAAQQRAQMKAGDRFSVATEMERRRRQTMAPQVEAGRAKVQDLGGANIGAGLSEEEAAAARQRAAGMGATVREGRDRIQALEAREFDVGESPDRSQDVEDFALVYEKLSDPSQRQALDQKGLERFYQSVASGGGKQALLQGGAQPDEVNAAQEIAQMELSRRARGQAKVAEEIVDEQTGTINQDDVESFDETIVELDPIYRGLVGLSRDQARSKILIGARVADTAEAQDALRKQWEFLDAPRETIADLFKSPEQVQREHRQELEDRFAKLRRPEKGISAKDQADINLKNERTLALRNKRKKEDRNKGNRNGKRGKGDFSSWDKLLQQSIDDIDKGLPEKKTAQAQLSALARELKDGSFSDVQQNQMKIKMAKLKKTIRNLDKAARTHREKMTKFRADLRKNRGSKTFRSTADAIYDYMASQPYLTAVGRITTPGGKREDVIMAEVEDFN
jgi:hypothetical protein